MKTGSTHIIADFWGCGSVLGDDKALSDHMERAVFEASATLLHIVSKEFQPQGVSILVILAESHMSLHTYPERSYAALDVFTCGVNASPSKAIDYLKNVLSPESTEIVTLQRGARTGIRVVSFSKAGKCCKLAQY